MDSRGRSRDVSPIALARQRLHVDHPEIYDDDSSPVIVLTPSHLALGLIPQPHDHIHPHTTTAKSRSTTPTTRNTPAMSTLSPDPSASGPLTPPEFPYSELDHRTLEYYDSPPSPPRTLQDQMQVAYALDNMHLAKVLLLKLQGIEVTSDDDPRIAQVKDADFSDAFVPSGGLMLDEEIEKRCREAERREVERKKRRAREERLKACERIWETSIRCLREEKDRVARRKDDKLREKRRVQFEMKEREREAKEKEAERMQDAFTRHTRQLRVPTHPSQRAVLSYGALPVSSPLRRQHKVDTSFQYAIMQAPQSPPSASSRHLSSSPKSPLRAYNDFVVQSRNVSFSDVIKGMHGPLFPLGVEEEG
ncbi:hypothetical protein EIP91_002581, partial [Steccherinum ochraceum]